MTVDKPTLAIDGRKSFYNYLLLLVAGLGGLLYGVDLGVIAGALPYLEATSGLNAGQLSFVVAAVLLGSVISTLFAGLLADWIGRKPLMILSGALFVFSIPTIALSHSYGLLATGRLLQGISAGLIGVVVPLYLAECLTASNRGKGTATFQWLLTLGIVAAAVVGMIFSRRVEQVARLGDAARLLDLEETAWRDIFWVSLPPGLLYVMGCLVVGESPRWLFRRGRKAAAYSVLLRSRTTSQADDELQQIEETAGTDDTRRSSGGKAKEALLRRKNIIPFVLACVILACNQATGVNSIIAYNTNILLQSGLSDIAAHWGYVMFTMVNFLMTFVGVLLVDRKGRKFLLMLGTAGIVVSLLSTGVLFLRSEKLRTDARRIVQSMVTPDQTLTLRYTPELANKLLGHKANDTRPEEPTSLVLIYSYGDFHGTTKVMRSDEAFARPIEITRASCVPVNKVTAFFSNPFGNLEAARRAGLRVDSALITVVPSSREGWYVAITLFVFIAFYALGPGVCVWLALSELMPLRIRSNGMSIALVLNQAVSTVIAAVFLPLVSRHGYSAIFFGFAAFSILYFATATWFLPETKGKTLEEIEAQFAGAEENILQGWRIRGARNE